MLQFLIGFAFLMVLLVPIGFFILSIIYSLGEELRHDASSKAKKKPSVQVAKIPVRERIRAVK
ncbi:hypothetical protein [Alkaliphilus hydrothermalis]|uniref:Multidrug efflux pump accessory protein AcrZ n=1 Tax=Alkaliphilus hydrothermalis TaxID=1482730 RepID=A0ABS2NPJ0_9FIRM|nr:hypothetical protein [Alkaliphilus hydrothermalis]MBM7614732.1 hypothetical protein [Alkaliphilus hydrothermalis]